MDLCGETLIIPWPNCLMTSQLSQIFNIVDIIEINLHTDSNENRGLHRHIDRLSGRQRQTLIQINQATSWSLHFGDTM